MPARHIPAALTAAVLLVLCAVAAAQAGPAPDEPVQPAPPPVGYCRTVPADWPGFGPAPSAAPDLTPYQDYRAGLGIDGSARGAGVTIADIEYEWRATHSELADRGLGRSGDSGLSPSWQAEDHGTAVLGIIGGSDDGRGVTGLAPDAKLEPYAPNTREYRPWREVDRVASTLEPGDVLLIELQAGLTTADGQTVYAPIEVYPAMRAAVRRAVDAGIVVVQPAGNSGSDLGEILSATGQRAPWLLGADADGHSGAILVGGGGAGRDESGTADRERAQISNHGPRVDLQGYGAGVVTAGYGDAPGSPSGDGAYTTCFDGTSSAAATVAAAVAVLQGAEIARDGSPLTPRQVRDLLVVTGAPQAGTAAGAIGPRPDVSAAIAVLPRRDSLPPPPAAAPLPPASAPTPPAGPAPQVTPAPPAPPAPVTGRASSGAPAPAAGLLIARVDRRARTLTLRLTGLAPRAVVRVAGRRVVVRAGRVVLRLPRGAVRVGVSVPAGAGATRRAVAFRVVVPARGGPRVTRLP